MLHNRAEIETIGMIGIVTVIILSFLTGCGDARKVDAIAARDFFDHVSLRLPISSPRATIGGGESTLFYSELTLEDMKQKIEQSDNSLKTAVYPHGLLVEKQNDNGLDNFYMIEDLSDNYSYFNMNAHLIDTGATDSCKKDLQIILPYHLISDTNMKYNNNTYLLGTNYSADYSADDFYNFYDSLNRYVLVKKDDGFTIQGFKDSLTYPDLRTPIDFRFSVKDNKNYFCITFE